MKKILYLAVAALLLFTVVFQAAGCTFVIGGAESGAQAGSEAASEADASAVSGEQSEPQTSAAASGTDSSEAEPSKAESSEAEPSKAESSEAEAPEAFTDEDAYHAYLDAVYKTNAFDDIHMISKSAQDMSITIPAMSPVPTRNNAVTTTDAIYCGRHSDTVIFEIHETQNNTKTDVYGDENNFYVKQGASDYVTISRTDPQAASIQSLISEENTTIRLLPQEAFRNSSMKTENGITEITIKPAADVLQESFTSMLDQYNTIFASMGAKNVNVEISSAEYTFVISKDGCITNVNSNIDMKMTMTIYSYSAEATVNADVKMEIVDPGKSFTIEFPDV
ncbi:MAG: hypothetical protein J6252_01635 [Clostridia bacterium]|nr:hypothetical protein [Clostridia bacterium]